MSSPIQIVYSTKRGFGHQESWIVTRGRTSYLRIIGDYPSYSVMTATASEDDRSYRVCSDKPRLISSALQLGALLNIPPSWETDRSKRKFIRVCQITFIPNRRDEDLKELFEVLGKFFEMYDSWDANNREVIDDMREVYAALSESSSDEDLYLSDGVWLSSDGRLHNRRR